MLHGPTAVFNPAPVAQAVAYTVLDAVVLGAALEVLDQRPLQQRQVVRMQTRFEVIAHTAYLGRIKPKQLA
ncbi:hypothetical protein D3C78_750710 [compost metagenome]